MAETDLEALADEIEAATETRAAWADMLGGPLKLEPQAAARADSDSIIHLIDRLLPGWAITIEGIAREPDGHWQCHLRQSQDRDNDEVIGSARGPVLRNVLLAALLRVIAYRGARGGG